MWGLLGRRWLSVVSFLVILYLSLSSHKYFRIIHFSPCSALPANSGPLEPLRAAVPIIRGKNSKHITKRRKDTRTWIQNPSSSSVLSDDHRCAVRFLKQHSKIHDGCDDHGQKQKSQVLSFFDSRCSERTWQLGFALPVCVGGHALGD
jgi:hypothetical protein